MAKITSPLMSLDASGSVAGTITFSKWKGRNYVRQTVTPSNPQSPGQVSTRAMMSFLSQAWKNIGATPQDTWLAAAGAKKISHFNAFTSQNMNRWTQFQAPGQSSPVGGTSQGAPLSSLTATGGVGQITISGEGASGGSPANWGIIIYASKTTGFTAAKSNVIAVVPVASYLFSYIYTGLAAGTWYFLAQAFSIDGGKETMHAQVSAAAT